MRIAEAAARTGLTARQIRYYQEAGVLPEPERSSGRHRAFTDRDLRRLALLKTLLAADVPPALAGRMLTGRVTSAERTWIDRRLGRQVTAVQAAQRQLAGEAGEDSSVDAPDISLMFDIFVLRTRMGAVLTAALAEVGLTAAEYALLSLLDGARARTLAELAQVLGAAPATLGRQLAELVRRGWVTRTHDPGDRRRMVFSLTRTGGERFRAAIPRAAQLAGELDRGVRQRGADPSAVRQTLQTLSTTLNVLGPDGAPD